MSRTPTSQPVSVTDGSISPFERRNAIKRLIDHLTEIGDFCPESDCPICSDSIIHLEVNRIQIARLEYRLKVKPLRSIVRTNLCVYCGDVATDLDHLLPRWWTGEALRPHVPTVSSCRSCNGILSDFPEPLIAARTQCISERLRRRWGKQLSRNPSLVGLQGNLKKQIAANNARRGVLRGRLTILELGGIPEISTDWQDHLILEGPLFIDQKPHKQND